MKCWKLRLEGRCGPGLGFLGIVAVGWLELCHAGKMLAGIMNLVDRLRMHPSN